MEYQHNEWTWCVEQESLEVVGPFQLEFAPDHIHKANVSGGPPYAIETNAPTLDTLILNARDCSGLFYHVHVANAFNWGGFPGFVHVDSGLPEPVLSLRKSLLPL